MFPGHAIKAQSECIIRLQCHGLKKTGIVVYETGRRTVLACALVLAGMAGYAHFLDSPGPVVSVIEQSRGEQGQPAAKPPQIKKNRSVRNFKPRNFSRQVHSAGSRHNIDPRLIHAVIEVESRGNPNAVSPRGAKGLMQITPGICKRYGVNNPFDIEQNINAGAAYLAHLLESLNGDLERALAAYNCGLGRVEMYKDLPPMSETRLFVNRIISKYRSRILNDLTAEGHSG